MIRHAILALAFFASILPPAAAAFAEPGTQLERVDLPTLTGGKEPFIRPDVKVNAFVFFRADQDRSVEALKQLAACEKELAGKSVHWVAVVSGAADPGEVQAVVVATGIKMPVVRDPDDRLYQKLLIRLHPVVGLADGKGVLKGLEAYRQLDYQDVVVTRIRFLLGEVDQATLDRALDPAASPLPGSDPMKKALRDVNLARRLFEIGQYDNAVKQAQKALEQAPVGGAFAVLGASYARLGKCGQARGALDQAQKADPGNAEIAPARALCAGK
jgi:tetratricopeptide (TPR) repeat protein